MCRRRTSTQGAELYQLAKLMRDKLTHEAHQPDSKLRFLVGHANALDALWERIDQDAEKELEASGARDMAVGEEGEGEEEEEDDADIKKDDGGYQSSSSDSSSRDDEYPDWADWGSDEDEAGAKLMEDEDEDEDEDSDIGECFGRDGNLSLQAVVGYVAVDCDDNLEAQMSQKCSVVNKDTGAAEFPLLHATDLRTEEEQGNCKAWAIAKNYDVRFYY